MYGRARCGGGILIRFRFQGGVNNVLNGRRDITDGTPPEFKRLVVGILGLRFGFCAVFRVVVVLTCGEWQLFGGIASHARWTVRFEAQALCAPKVPSKEC